MPLSVKDGMGAWVKDFQDSNAPQFKGKSDKERREMAIAAYLSAKRGDRNESVEENVSAPQTAAHRRAMMGIPKKKKDEPPFTPDPPKPAAKNSDGTKTSPMSRAKQLAKKARDAQPVDEAHAYSKAAKALHDYGTKHGGIDKKDFHTAAKHLDRVGKAPMLQKSLALQKMNDHFKGLDTDVRDRIHMTLRQHGVMEAVQVDELKKSTLGSYVKKASQDAGAKAYSAAQKAMSNPDQSGKDYVKSVKRQKGIARATDKLTNEAGTPERLAMIRKAGEKYNKEKKKAERDAKRAMSKDRDMMGEANLEEALNSNDYAALEKKHDELSAYHSKEAKRHHDASENNSDDHAAARKMHNNAAKHHEAASRMARAAKDVTGDPKMPSHKVTATKTDYVNTADRAHRNSQRARDAATAADKSRNESVNEAVNNDLYNSDVARKAHVGKVRARKQPDGSRRFYADVHNHVKAKAIGRKDTAMSASSPSLGYKSRKHAKDIADKLAHLHNTGAANRDYAMHTTHHKKYGNVEEAKSFDQKFRDHLKFATSKSPAVRAYLKKRAADRDAMNKELDPNAANKGYALSAVPPERAFGKARKKGMSAAAASQAVGTASRNRGRKLPK